jgi:hypothetical protein
MRIHALSMKPCRHRWRRVLTLGPSQLVTVPPPLLKHERKFAHATPAMRTSTTASSPPASEVVVYHSPLGSIITRLRAVSITSSVVGTVALPVAAYLKASTVATTAGAAVATTTSVAPWAFLITAVVGTLSSTAAIHCVFGPYVYQITQIPIRKCHSQQTDTDQTADQAASIPLEQKNVVLKITTKSLFLRPIDTLWDPYRNLGGTADVSGVQPYRGWRPLANVMVHDIPLYIHPEYLPFQSDLYQQLFGWKEGDSSQGAAQRKRRRKDDDDDDGLF